MPIRIVILQGENSVLNVKIGRSPATAIQVVDMSSRPVQGATVRFELPASGPGGAFLEGGTTAVVRTDEGGLAQLPPWKPRTAEGPFSIEVFATFQAASARSSIPQRIFVPEADANTSIKILVQEGDNAVHKISKGSATALPLVVKVVDKDQNPVRQANVTFALPQTGAGGTFADQRREVTVQTNNEGLATEPQFTPANVDGAFNVRVTARFQGDGASVDVAQRTFIEQAPPSKPNPRIWVLVAGGGAAALAAWILPPPPPPPPCPGAPGCPRPTIGLPGTGITFPGFK